MYNIPLLHNQLLFVLLPLNSRYWHDDQICAKCIYRQTFNQLKAMESKSSTTCASAITNPIDTGLVTADVLQNKKII